MTPPTLLAIVGPTATGKSALAIALAQRTEPRGEIVNCDSTAVYQQFDIGTDKVPVAEQQGVPHHLVDILPPTERYSAARYAEAAASVIRDISSRAKMPILVGGTGLYYRALTRGIFPGPARDDRVRERLHALARRRGPEQLHRMVMRLDPASAARILPRDEKRLVRALEVTLITGKPLSAHFVDTRSPLDGYRIVTLGLRLPAAMIAARVAKRVDAQFARGLLDEVRTILARGVPPDAHPFSGLVYRQVMDFLRGERDVAATRELIVQENRRYARRQLIWFRKEPNLEWLDGPGEEPATLRQACAALCSHGIVTDGPNT
jgi:tRNA dimethylallyltransferase